MSQGPIRRRFQPGANPDQALDVSGKSGTAIPETAPPSLFTRQAF
jgi:hypothetical protein